MAKEDKQHRVFTRKHGMLEQVTREQAETFVKNNKLDDYTIFDGKGVAVERGEKGPGY